MACAAGVITVLVLGGEAQAQHWSLHVGGAVAAGWTDNAASAPDEPDEGEAPPRPAFFTRLRPSVLFTFESPGTTHETSLVFDLLDYQGGEPPTTLNVTLGHESLLELTQAIELGLTGALSTARVSPVLSEPGGDMPPAMPGGASTFIRGDASEVIRWALARRWRLEQRATYAQASTRSLDAAGVTTSEIVSRDAGVSLGVERSWLHTAAAVTGGAGYIGITEVRAGPDDITRHATGTASLELRRDLGERWSMAAQVGVLALSTFESTRAGVEGSTTTPVGRLALIYFRPLGRATGTLAASARRTVGPNMLLGTTVETTSVALAGTLPLPWLLRVDTPTVTLRTTIGRAYAEVADAGLAEPPTWHIDTVDVALVWSPHEVIDLALRFQRLDSVVPEASRAGAELADLRIPVDFTRHTVLFEISGRWPSRPAAIMPDRRLLRVDRSNERLPD